MSDVIKKKKPSLLLYLLLGTVALITVIAIVLFFLLSGFNKETALPREGGNATIIPDVDLLETVTEGNRDTSTVPTPSTVVTTTETSTSSETSSSEETTEGSTTRQSSDEELPELTTTTETIMRMTTLESTTLSELTTSTVDTTTVTTESTTTSEATTSATETTTEVTTSEPVTETTTTSETATPIDVSNLLDTNQELASKVEKCSAVLSTAISCPIIAQEIRPVDASNISELGHLSGFRPIHYNLTLSVQRIAPPFTKGNIHIFLEAVEDGNQVVLNAGRALRDLTSVRVVACGSAKPICVSKFVRDTNSDQIFIILSENIHEGDIVRVDAQDFVGIEPTAFFQQIPPTWERKAPKMLGSQFLLRNARNVFPCVDHPAFKAPLSLCIAHPSGFKARSNSEALSSVPSTVHAPNAVVTCFKKTVPLASHQYGFVIEEGAESRLHNATTLRGVSLPATEVVFSQGERFYRRNESTEWVYEETAKVLATLIRWTGLQYPLDKLTIVSAPMPPPVQMQSASGGPGLILLPDKIFEFPKHTMSRETLMREVIRQYIGGLVTVKDWKEACLQESLIVYISSLINEELKIMNRARPNTLFDLPGGRPADLLRERLIAVTKDFNSQAEIQRTCSDKVVSIFYSIDETFGKGTVLGMITKILSKHSFGNAGIEEYSTALEEQTGSQTLGSLFRRWFSDSSRPVISVKVASNEVQLSQLTDNFWTLPIELGGSAGTHRIDVTEKNQSIAYTSMDYVIIDPKRRSVAVVGYDLETYLRLIRCWDDSRCPSNKAELKDIFNDLAIMLMADLIKEPSSANRARWNTVFRFGWSHNLWSNDMNCCVRQTLREPEDPRCFFVLHDKCAKVDLFRV